MICAGMISSGQLFVKFLLFLIIYCPVVASEETLRLEAEEGTTTGELRWRESASKKAAIYLNNGEHTSNLFNTETECCVRVLNVRHSEGSIVDIVTVLIDEQNMGTFRTTASSNSEDPWNIFHDSGQVGGKSTVTAGEHTVKVTVSAIDEYGMEVDYIELSVRCENTNEDCNGPDDHSSLTVGEIIGIVLAVVGTLGLLVPVVVVVLKFVMHRRGMGIANLRQTQDGQDFGCRFLFMECLKRNSQP